MPSKEKASKPYGMLTSICTVHIGLNLGGSTFVVFVSARASIAFAATQQDEY